MFNRAQPPRPPSDEEGPIWFRTQPKKVKRIPRFFALHHIICAMRLYRAAREGAIPSGATIADIYDYVFYTPELQRIVSKNTMGSSIVNTVIYEPRILKNKTRTGEGAFMTYVFRHSKDLEYGLEWQICAPLVRWMQMDLQITTQPIEEQVQLVSETLEDIATFSEHDYVNDFENQIAAVSVDLMMKEPDWREIWRKHPERVVMPPKLAELITPRPSKPDPF